MHRTPSHGYSRAVDHVRALARAGHGAPFFALWMFVFLLVSNLYAQDSSLPVAIVSALVGAVVAGTLWFVVMRYHSRRRRSD